MMGDEQLCGGLGSCRAPASQDGQHPAPMAATAQQIPPFHSLGNHSIPLLPAPPPIPMATAASPPYLIPMTTAASCSHSRVLETLS